MRSACADVILAAVDDLPEDACGAFVVELDDVHVGSVFVERNQVCWAAAAGLRRRLLDLLRESLIEMLTPADIEEMYQRCSQEGRRIGEELVSHSLVQGDVMRAAIKQHTIESLIALPEQLGERITWVPHSAEGYHPRFTFAPVEISIGVNERLFATEAAGAELALAVLDDGIPGAAFARDDDGDPVPVRIVGTHATIADVIDLGTWAEAALGASPGFSPEVLARAVQNATGTTHIAWQTSRFLVYAAVISDRGALERTVAAIQSRNFPLILSRRASRTASSNQPEKETETWQPQKRLSPS